MPEGSSCPPGVRHARPAMRPVIEGRRRQPMIKHDAVRRALGAAWVLMFLTTLLLPVGTAIGAARPSGDDDGASPAPFVDAQGALAPSIASQIDEADPAAAEPPPAAAA